MNIEEAIDILENSIADYVIGEYCEKCADNKICDDRNEDCYYQQAIDTVVTAYEKENSTFINKTSYIENCETSALGRALGIAGFGIDTSVASAEEVQNAINNQNDDKLELMNKMNKLEVETETNHEDMLQYYGVESNNQMSIAQLKDCIKKLEKKASK